MKECSPLRRLLLCAVVSWWWAGTTKGGPVERQYDHLPEGLADAQYSASSPTAWTIGSNSVLYIPVDFSDKAGDPISSAEALNVMSQVSSRLSNYSYGQMDIPNVAVTPTLRLPQTAAWYGSNDAYLQLRQDAVAAASGAGYNTGDYWSHIVAFSGIDGWWWAGRGYVGAPGVWLNGYVANLTVITHELGHNLGAWHSSFWDTTDPDDIIGPGTQDEYGDPFDEMGGAWNGPHDDFGAYWKAKLDWIDDADQIITVDTGAITRETYRIYAFDQGSMDPARDYAVVIPRDADHEYWLSYRAAITSNGNLTNGVLFNWDPCAEIGPDIALLDMTPGSQAGWMDRMDAALEVGEVFVDQAFGSWFQLRPTAVGTSPAPWIDVQVSISAEGDANHDGIVNILDLANLSANWQGTGRAWGQGDFNADGVVNILDLADLSANWRYGEVVEGDTNTDGIVNILDLSTLSGNWQQTGKTWPDGDFNGDGIVNILDLSDLSGNWGYGEASSSVTPDASAAQASSNGVVPEPATLALLLLGGAALIRRRH